MYCFTTYLSCSNASNTPLSEQNTATPKSNLGVPKGHISVDYSLDVAIYLLSDFVDGAVEALHKAGALPVIRSTPDSSEFKEIEEYKSKLLTRFLDLSFDISS